MTKMLLPKNENALKTECQFLQKCNKKKTEQNQIIKYTTYQFHKL